MSQYWTERHDRPKNAKLAPSHKTLQMEAQLLRQAFRRAHRDGLLAREPFVAVPSKKPTEPTRRPDFDDKAWSKLREYLEKWSREAPTATSGPNATAASHRLMFYDYVLILCNTGLRPNEARLLCWENVEPIVDTEGNKQIQIRVPTAKTKSRIAIARGGTQEILDRLRSRTDHSEPHDYVFCYVPGKPIDVATMSTKFSRVLVNAGLERDQSKRRRSLYSLRHSYATFRLLSGVSHLDLAQNMGTSVKMLEDHYSHIKPVQVAHVLGRREKSKRSRNALF